MNFKTLVYDSIFIYFPVPKIPLCFIYFFIFSLIFFFSFRASAQVFLYFLENIANMTMEFNYWNFLHTYKEEQFQWVIRDFFTHTETVQEVTHESASFIIDFTRCILRLSRSDRFDVWSLYIISENRNNLNLNGLEHVILGLKKVDGSLEEQFYMRKTDTDVGKEYLLNYWTNSELLERKHELTSSDDLTVILTSKRRITAGKSTTKHHEHIFHGLPSWKLISKYSR